MVVIHHSSEGGRGVELKKVGEWGWGIYIRLYTRGTDFKIVENRSASAIPQNDLCDTQNRFLNLFLLKNFQKVPVNQIFLLHFHKSKKFAISRLKFLPPIKAVF